MASSLSRNLVTWPDLWFGPVNLWNAPKSAREKEVQEDKSGVIVYSKTVCPQCVKVKSELTLKGVEFREVKIDGNPEVAKWLIAQGHRQVPVVYVDGVHTNPATITSEIVN